jgi:hypothetical protein
MTWNARDAMPQPKRGKVAAAPGGGRSDAKPLPEQVPTYAQRSASLMHAETDGEFRFTQAQERELIAEGIWPDRQWGIWRHAMQRGIQAY